MTIDARGGRAEPTRRTRSTGAAAQGPAARVGGRRVGLVLTALAVVGLSVAVIELGRPKAPGASISAPPASGDERPTIAAQVLSDPDKFVALERMGKAQVDAILKDPDSAEYKDVVAAAPPAAKGSVTFCGLVNAKSSFGGYTGYTRFIAAPNVGAWLRNSPGIKFRQVWRDICQDRYVISKAEFVN